MQSSGKLEKAEILEMTVQYLRALHSADFPRGREKGGRGLRKGEPGRGPRATQRPGGGSGSEAALARGLSLSGCCRGGGGGGVEVGAGSCESYGDWSTGVWGYRFRGLLSGGEGGVRLLRKRKSLAGVFPVSRVTRGEGGRPTGTPARKRDGRCLAPASRSRSERALTVFFFLRFFSPLQQNC